MIELQLNENKLGKEYINALIRAINIRKERRLIYGDSFLDDDINLLVTILEGKLNRFKIGKSKEKKIDEMLDIINYAAFIVAKLEK